MTIHQQTETADAISPPVLLRSDRLGILAVAPAAGTTVGAAYALASGPVTGIAAGLATVAGLVLCANAWGLFCLVRLLLATIHNYMPIRLMIFLREAHARGILRQAGGFYQFRHRLLQDRLTTLSAPPTTAASFASAGVRATTT